nr:MAG TPA: hypothetical protein [Caudoviricetes sp.]
MILNTVSYRSVVQIVQFGIKILYYFVQFLYRLLAAKGV